MCNALDSIFHDKKLKDTVNAGEFKSHSFPQELVPDSALVQGMID